MNLKTILAYCILTILVFTQFNHPASQTTSQHPFLSDPNYSLPVSQPSPAPYKYPTREYHNKKWDIPLSPVFKAAYEGTLSQVSDDEILAEINKQHPQSGDTMAHLAPDGRTLDRILQHSLDILFIPNTTGNTPLHQIVRQDNGPELLQTIFKYIQFFPDKIEELLKSINESGDTPAHTAARSGKYKNLQYLIGLGADLKLRNKKNETVQMIASRAIKNPANIAEYNDAIEKGLTLFARHQQSQFQLPQAPNNLTPPATSKTSADRWNQQHKEPRTLTVATGQSPVYHQGPKNNQSIA